MITRTYITRTLSDILPGYDEFNAEVMSKLNFKMTEDEKEYLFTLVYSKYADSHARYTNESLFILNLKKEIMVYYPQVLAIIRDQKKMRDTSDTDFARAGRTMVNMGAHNTANLPTTTMEGVNQLDTQTVQNNERAAIDVLMQRMDLYRSGFEDHFLDKFVKLFVQIISPQRDLLYITEAAEYGSAEESPI